jgi:hypothetical protein
MIFCFVGDCALSYTVHYEDKTIVPHQVKPNPKPTSWYFSGSQVSHLNHVEQAFVQVRYTGADHSNSGSFIPQMVLISVSF